MSKVIKLSLVVLFLIQGVVSQIAKAASWTEEFELDIKDSSKIHINAGRGDFKLETKKGLKSVSATMKISIPGDLESAKHHFNTKMKAYLKHQGKVIKLKAAYKEGFATKQMKGKIDLVVMIPEKLYLSLYDTQGDIHITGLRNGLKVDDGKGKIKITDSSGAATINDASGMLELKRTKGKLKINDGDDDVRITDHRGEVIINDNRGDILLVNIQGKVRVSDRTGLVDAKGVKGDIRFFSF